MDARGCWYAVGPLMGLTVVGMSWATNRPLGALGGYIDLHDWLRRPSAKIGWQFFFLVGVIGGGLLHAFFAGGTIDDLKKTGELKRMTEKWHLPYLLRIGSRNGRFRQQ